MKAAAVAPATNPRREILSAVIGVTSNLVACRKVDVLADAPVGAAPAYIRNPGVDVGIGANRCLASKAAAAMIIPLWQ